MQLIEKPVSVADGRLKCLAIQEVPRQENRLGGVELDFSGRFSFEGEVTSIHGGSVVFSVKIDEGVPRVVRVSEARNAVKIPSGIKDLMTAKVEEALPRLVASLLEDARAKQSLMAVQAPTLST